MRTLLALLFTGCLLQAATYYVRTDGNNSNAGTSNTSGGAWLTIDYAADHVSAGDTVRIAAGIYLESVTPGVSGSEGNYITFVADSGPGTVTNTSWTISGRQYLRLVNLTVDAGSATDWIRSYGSHYIEVWHCEFKRGFDGIHQDHGTKANYGNNSLFIGNRFYGTLDPGGEAKFFEIRGTNNIVAHNTMSGQNADSIYWFGVDNRFLNNVASSPNSESASHVDMFQTGTDSGVGNLGTLIEANMFIDSDTPSDNHHLSNCSNSGSDFTHMLWRRNVAHQVGTYVHNIFLNWANVYLVHESYVDAHRFGSSVEYGVVINSTVENGRYRNNLGVKLWTDDATSYVLGWYLGGSGRDSDYNLGFDPDMTVAFTSPTTSESNSLLNQDPDLVDYAADDFRLQAVSPAIGAAGPLTTVSSENGSGTTFTVADAGFFRGDNTAVSQYGGNLVVGDTITVGTDVLTISSISGNDITVTGSFTWAQNDPVYFGTDTTPDMGALPYSHTPLTTATISAIGSTYTVTPTGDVRWVVFFQDGIPHTVDNASPFTATISSGTVTAKAYALYAQANPVVTATEGEATQQRGRMNGVGKIGKGKL